MNISNSIQTDLTYSKSDSSQGGTEQNVPAVREKSHFSGKLNQVNKKENFEEIVEVINQSNKNLQTFDRKLDISVHEKTREIMVKVIDTSTDEVIREIPPEKVLDFVASRKEAIGLLMDQKI